jgi:hypothetical protein
VSHMFASWGAQASLRQNLRNVTEDILKNSSDF